MITTIATAALFAIKINFASILGRTKQAEPKVTCHIATVSYKFVGEPGTTFTYDGESYTVPRNGWVELLAAGGPTVYHANGRELPLEVWPRDDMGMRTVPLPKSNQVTQQAALNAPAR